MHQVQSLYFFLCLNNLQLPAAPAAAAAACWCCCCCWCCSRQRPEEGSLNFLFLPSLSGVQAPY